MSTEVISIDANQQIVKFNNFSISYDNLSATKQTVAEIFDELPYQFSSDKKQPFIIDAGSNIGVATLFFKKYHPDAKIICFEPDPNAFERLQVNVSNNKLKNIDLINAALARKDGEIDFFGQIFVDSPDARGNSIIGTWGLQRKVNNTIKVKSVRLSSYINCEVDFLKMDVEGAEQQILEELEEENKLSIIKEIGMEIHESEKIKNSNDRGIIINILKRNQFKITVVEKNLKASLPKQVRQWVSKINPQLCTLKATRL